MRIRTTGMDALMNKLTTYRSSIESRKRLFLERLAALGINVATLRFQNAQYDGRNDVVVSQVPEWVSDSTLFITATGSSLLFIEFGSGMIGYGHPQAADLGYGPGTWSDDETKGGKHHWQQGDGWYYEHGKKSKGNPPARAMYDAAKEMRNAIAQIAREVFYL